MNGTQSLSPGKGRLDRLAIGVSALCLVHCLSTAVLVGVVSSVGAAFDSPLIHEVGLGLALVLGVVALGRGIIQHRRFLPSAIGGLGLGMMAGALVLPHGGWEAIATIAGVSMLALGHYMNRLALA